MPYWHQPSDASTTDILHLVKKIFQTGDSFRVGSLGSMEYCMYIFLLCLRYLPFQDNLDHVI